MYRIINEYTWTSGNVHGFKTYPHDLIRHKKLLWVHVDKIVKKDGEYYITDKELAAKKGLTIDDTE